MTADQQNSSFIEKNDLQFFNKDVEIKSISFLNTEFKYFIVKTTMTCKGTIVVFAGWPGGPADPSTNLKYIVKVNNESMQFPSLCHYCSPFTDYGYNFIVFDYPGFWFNSLTFNIKDGIQFGIKILTNIKKNYPDLPIYVFGHSFGGAMALNCIADFKSVQKIFVHSPMLPPDGFASKESYIELMAFQKAVADQHFVNSTDTFWEHPNDAQIFFDKLHFETKVNQIKALNIPLKIVIGQNDGVFSATKAKNYFSKFNIDVDIIKNLPHSVFEPEILKQYILRITNFFSA